MLASTTVPETWVFSTGGYLASDPAGCNDSRGVLFSPNASTTWESVGNFALGYEKNLRNYSSNWDNGNYGFDTLALGYSGSGGPNVESTVIAGLNTKDFYLGDHRSKLTPDQFHNLRQPCSESPRQFEDRRSNSKLVVRIFCRRPIP